MTPTLSDLRRLLEGGLTRGGPGIDRLPERTVEAMVMAYLPRSLSALDGERALHYHAVHMLLWWSGIERLDLTDPGTTHALLVALALYLGNDPREGGIGASWFFLPATPPAPWRRWCLMAESLTDFADLDNGYTGSIYAPTVAAEPNPVKALALAAVMLA